MYESFYGFREKPFSLLPDPGFFYMSAKHKAALSLLEDGIFNRAGFVVITGGIGTGKTLLIRKIMSEARQDLTIGLISNTHRNLGNLMQWILRAFGLRAKNGDAVEMFQEFSEFLTREHAINRRVSLVVDEAQNLEPEMLEELRLLSNTNSGKEQVLQIVLSGQPGLRDLLRRSDLVQFAQRVDAEYHLDPMDEEETGRYIRHRTKTAGTELSVFDEKALPLIYRLTGGVPRLVNQVCERALVYGFAEQAKKISARLVAEAASDRIHGRIVPFIKDVDLSSFLREEAEKIVVQKTKGNGSVSPPDPYSTVEVLRKESPVAYKRGVELRASGRYDEAIQSFEKAARDPSCWLKAFFLIGLCYRDLGRTRESLESFRTALSDHSAVDQEVIGVRYEMGRILEDQGNVAEALDCYQRIRLVEPGFNDVTGRIERLSASSLRYTPWFKRFTAQLKRNAYDRFWRPVKGVYNNLIKS